MLAAAATLSAECDYCGKRHHSGLTDPQWCLYYHVIGGHLAATARAHYY